MGSTLGHAALLAFATLAACGKAAPKDGASPSSPPSSSGPSSGGSAASPLPSASAAPSGSGALSPITLPPGGEDFTADARDLFRVAACGGTGPVPQGLDAGAIDAHCDQLKKQVDEYVSKWLDVATPFIAKIRPAGLPSEVVYPFGGGDLVTALVVYPDLSEVTTISLEPAGDVRKF